MTPPGSFPAGLARTEGLRLREREPLAPKTTWRIGGPARWFAEVGTLEALARLLGEASAARVPALPLGKGSNVLFSDEGFAGLVFVLSGNLAGWRIESPLLEAGGGAGLMALAAVAKSAGLSGLESLCGIPSTFGGAVRINAGAYGGDIFDLLENVTLVSLRGETRTLSAPQIPHGYRRTGLMEHGDVVASGRLRLVPRPEREIASLMADVTRRRKEALPLEPNAGSVFRNPAGQYAGKLLEECGLKGRRIGGAEVSLRHANVVVNRGGATARDVLSLMDLMRREVGARFGVELEPEVEVVGPAGASVEWTGCPSRPLATP